MLKLAAFLELRAFIYSFSGYVYEVEEGAQSCERFSCSDRVVMSDYSIFTEGDFPSTSEG